MSDLLAATVYVHSCGVTHRDIKPENILLQKARGQEMWSLKLADFGMAAYCSPGQFLGGAGTVPYMSPEQLKNSCNETCDVWACGCVLYDLVCGEYLVSPDLWGDRGKTYEFLFSVDYGAKLRLFDERCG